MLAELQHLQALTSRLTEQLKAKRLENQQLRDELATTGLRPEDEQARQALLQQLEALQEQHSLSEKNHLDLANRHAELKQAHEQLQLEHQELAQEQSTLELEKIRLENEVQQFAEIKSQLEAERDALVRKNDFAKQKVEAIIHRLSMLGQTPPETSH